MGGGVRRRADAPRLKTCAQWFGLGGALLLALGAAACNSTTAQAPAPMSSARGPTIAFESIDGPPESIYTKLVKTLTEEAGARQIAVVSRGAPAQYRVRIYAANIVYSKRSVVHWVWDVYDANQQRARRLSGEEPMTGAGHTTWAAADDQLIRKVARVGMDRLVAFLANPREPTSPQPRPGAAPAVAMAAE
jgi:ABC-type transport auxiliary lipoprotein component